MTLYRGVRREVDLRQYKEGGAVVWAAFSSTSPDMKVTKAFLSKKMKDPEENEEVEEDGKSGGTLTGGNSEKDQKKGKNSARGDTLHHRRCVGLRHRALFDL